MSPWPMKVLYDGACPFCRREIDWLRRRNQRLNLAFEDITAADFDPQRYGLTRKEVEGRLHGILRDGSIVRGAEAVRRMYEAIGMGWLVAPTRLPGIKEATDLGYRMFAKNRRWLGRLFGRPACSASKCRCDKLAEKCNDLAQPAGPPCEALPRNKTSAGAGTPL